MFDNSSPYALRRKVIGGLTHYYIVFKDGQAVAQEVEVSRVVYLEFTRFIKQERNLRRSDERHIEQSELTEATLHKRAADTQKDFEDSMLDHLRDERLRQAISDLPEVQRRRFILYYEYGLTYEQIAEIDGRHFTSIRESILVAEEKIRGEIEKVEN